MAVTVQVRTEADVAALQRYQKELGEARKKLITSGKSVGDFTAAMRKLDSQQRALNKLMPETHSATSKLKDMFGGVTITAGDVANGIKTVAREAWSWAKAGAEAEKATQTLRFAVEKAGISWGANSAAIEANIQKVSWLAAVDDEELAVAQSKLVRSTGDLEQSQKMLGLATDISAVTGRDLEAVTKALGQAYNGNYGALKKLGVQVGDVSSSTEAMQTLYQTFGGAAAYVNDNLIGDAHRVTIAWDNLKESAGQAFGPMLSNDLESTSLALQLLSNQTLSGGEKWEVYWQAYGGAHDDLAAVKEALGLNTSEFDKMSSATFRATQAQQELTQAQQDYAHLSSSAEQGSINLARAENSLEDATRRQADALAKSGANSREYEDATLDVRQAELNLQEAKAKNADNASELAAMQAEIDKLTLLAQAAEAAKRGYRTSSGKVGGTGGNMMAVGGILPATPGGISVTAAEAGVDEAFIPLERTRTSQNLAAEVAARVGVNVSQPAAPVTNITNLHFHGQVASYSETLRAVRDAERSLAW